MSDKKMDKALIADMGIDKEELKKLKKKLLKAEGFPERGIETWFRLTSKNLYTRRAIVDTKSNILVTVNSIMMSVVLGSLYPRLDQDPHLIYAVGPLLLTNLISMGYAIFATRPKTDKGTYSKDDIDSQNLGLMTFDDFHKMPEAEYEEAVSLLMEDREFLYRSIKKDIHRLGVDLSERYRRIKMSYDVFLVGLVISLTMFAACHVFY